MDFCLRGRRKEKIVYFRTVCICKSSLIFPFDVCRLAAPPPPYCNPALLRRDFSRALERRQGLATLARAPSRVVLPWSTVVEWSLFSQLLHLFYAESMLTRNLLLFVVAWCSCYLEMAIAWRQATEHECA